MPALKPKTKVLFTCPDTGKTLKGYVRSSGPHGADITVFDPRYKEPASKDSVAFDEQGSKGTFKLDPEPDEKPKTPDDLKDAKIASLEAEVEKLKTWIKKSIDDKKVKAETPKTDDKKMADAPK